MSALLPVGSTASINSEGTRSGVKRDHGSGADKPEVNHCKIISIYNSTHRSAIDPQNSTCQGMLL